MNLCKLKINLIREMQFLEINLTEFSAYRKNLVSPKIALVNYM